MRKITRLKLAKLLSLIAFVLFAVIMAMSFISNSLGEEVDEEYASYLDAEPDTVAEIYAYDSYSDAYDFYVNWLMALGFLMFIVGGVLFALMSIVLSLKENIGTKY